MPARISVIIPCYNQGHFLKDTLDSLATCDPSLYEAIIVNDGSTDSYTNEYLQQLSGQGYNVIHRENGGLCAARNTGIKASNGEFVIMLDADNKIRPAYLTKGLEAMDKFPDVMVVFGNAMFFGDLTGLRKQEPFNLQKQLLTNYIDACGMIRKTVFETTGLYDEKMREGWEDWEMWLRIGLAGFRFYYIDDVLYDYRVRKDSMSRSVYHNKEKTNRVENYIYNKYPDKIGIQYVTDFMIDRFRRNPIGFLVKLFMRAYWPSRYRKLLKENKIRNGL
jgi:glycosyltransferase involved in cell wall biosynthesis